MNYWILGKRPIRKISLVGSFRKILQKTFTVKNNNDKSRKLIFAQ